MVNRRAFIRTLEAVLAVLVSYTFLVAIIPVGSDQAVTPNYHILNGFEQDETFRHCALSSNSSCIDAYVETQLPNDLEYRVIMTDDPDEVPALPDTRVFSEHLFLAGNNTVYSPVIIKLFYWYPER